MPPMPRLAASRITSTGKCFSSSQRSAWGAIFSPAKSRAISRTAIWSSSRAKCIRYPRFPILFSWTRLHPCCPSLRGAEGDEAIQGVIGAIFLDCFASLAMTESDKAASLTHRRNREFRAFLDPGRPARGYRLGLGVEADRIRPVLVEVAEAGLFPAAEGVIGDRHRDRHVDADHADIDLGREVARGVAVAGEDGNAVAVIMLRRQRQRFLVVVRAHHREHRAKDLFLVDPHVLGDVVEQRTTEIETFLVALHLETAAVDGERRAFLDADIDVALDLLDRLACHERTVVRRRIDRGADLER